MKKCLCLALVFLYVTDAFAAKKDFKGLFGNYRREKFTENEGNASDFGFDILLSTLLPVTPIVKSQESSSSPQNNLNYATFFNLEGGINYSFGYHWLTSLTVGYYNYDTRKENTVFTNPALPLFHQFEMNAIPVVLGVKYRFSRQDIVPYVGLGVGASFVTRKASYDYSPNQKKEVKETALTGQAMVGVEFYISSRAGIRLEASGFFMKLNNDVFDARAGSLPVFYFQGNNWSVRYASGLFFLL